MKSGLVPKVRQQGCGSRSFPNLGKLPVFFCQSDEAGKLESFPLMQLQALNVQWAMNTREICGFVDDIYDIVKKRWKFVDFFGLSTSAGLHNISYKQYCWWVQDWAWIQLKNEKLYLYQEQYTKSFALHLLLFNPNKKKSQTIIFLKLNLHIFLLEICLKMKNQRKNTTGSVSNAVYADGLCQHCFDFRNYFFCF